MHHKFKLYIRNINYVVKSKLKSFKKFLKGKSNSYEGVSFIISNVSAVCSLVLSIISIYLAIQISKQKQQVQDLDKVISELVKQNNIHGFELTELKNSNYQTTKMINELISLTRLTKTQNDFLTESSKPIISFGNGEITPVKDSIDLFEIEFTITNTGEMPAYNLNCSITGFLTKQGKIHQKILDAAKVDFHINDIRIDPNGKVGASIYLETKETNLKKLVEAFFFIKYHYSEKRRGKLIFEERYLQNSSSDVKKIEFAYISKAEKKLIQQYLLLNRK